MNGKLFHLPFYSMSKMELNSTDFHEKSRKYTTDRKLKTKIFVGGTFFILVAFGLGMLTGHFGICKLRLFTVIIENKNSRIFYFERKFSTSNHRFPYRGIFF